MPRCPILLILAFTGVLHSQSALPVQHSPGRSPKVHSSWKSAFQLPRPYARIGADLGGGGGYAPFEALAAAGFQMNSEHVFLDTSASYENARKVNDNDQPNPKGHIRSLDGGAYYRVLSQWLFGGAAEWEQLSTSNYRKSNWHPRFGGGRDLFTRGCAAEGCAHDFTARLTAEYVLRGGDWQNGCQGPLFSFYMPSPSAKKHIFFRETIGIYRFHDTVTDRSDPQLTSQESSVHHFMGVLQASLMYRF